MADGNEESENFFRLVRLIVDVGSKVLRDVLVHIIKPDTIDTVLQANVQTINRLYHGRPKILFDNEFTLLTETPPNPEKFDITLLVKICRNICPAICPHLIPPNYDWSPQSSPGQNDISLADDIYRMREYRNSIFAHISNTTVPYVKFLDLWTEIKAVVCRMSIHGSPGLKQDIDNTIYKLQTENVNPSSLKGLLVELRAWHEQDGKEHQDILKELKQTRAAVSVVKDTQATKETQLEHTAVLHGIRKTVDEIKANVVPKSGAAIGATDQDRKRLREYLQSRYKDGRYCKVTPLPDWVGLTVRDIFSPVVLVRDSKDNQETVESTNDPFNKKMTLQKKIILLGGAGAGKTKFCKHLIERWCNPTSKSAILR